MRVLFISSWYPTPANAGLGIFVREHARAIKSSGVDLRVLAVVVLRDESYLRLSHREYTDESGIQTYEIIIYSRLRDVFHHLVAFQSYIAYRYFKKHIYITFQPDVVHSNVVFPAGMLGDYFARRLNRPHVLTEHWSKIESFLQKIYFGKKAERVYQRADVVLPVSEYLRTNLLRIMPALAADKLHVIPNVISSDVFGFRTKVTEKRTLNFCAVATWATKRIPDKYPELFIKALSALHANGLVNVRLTMVGGGDRVDELKALCKQCGVETLFTGALSKKEIAEVLKNSDYFLHASRTETFGVVVVEALMTGTPVVCSKVAALPELIQDGVNGVLCENTIESWIDGIKRAISLTYNYQMISEVVVQKYSYQQVGTEICDVYRTLE